VLILPPGPNNSKLTTTPLCGGTYFFGLPEILVRNIILSIPLLLSLILEPEIGVGQAIKFFRIMFDFDIALGYAIQFNIKQLN